jgi:hypothetical protein
METATYRESILCDTSEGTEPYTGEYEETKTPAPTNVLWAAVVPFETKFDPDAAGRFYALKGNWLKRKKIAAGTQG